MTELLNNTEKEEPVIDLSNKILKQDSSTQVVPLYINFHLLNVIKTQEIYFNVRIALQIDIPIQHMLDNIEEQMTIDYDQKKQLQDELLKKFSSLRIRVNNRVKYIEESMTIEKELQNDKDDVIVGKTQEQRMELEDLLINVHGDMNEYPFDEQTLPIDVKVEPIEFQDLLIKFNLHEPYNMTDNLFLSISEEEDLNKMDIFCLYKNKKGFEFELQEDHYYSQREDGTKDLQYHHNGFKVTIHLQRDPGFTMKIAIFPSLLLLFFSSGVCQFGDNLAQQEGLLIFFLAFITQAQLAINGIQKTSCITFVDKLNAIGYFLALIQQICIFLSQFVQMLQKNIVEKQDNQEIHQLGLGTFSFTIGMAFICMFWVIYKYSIQQLYSKPIQEKKDEMTRTKEDFQFEQYKCLVIGKYPTIFFDYNRSIQTM